MDVPAQPPQDAPASPQNNAASPQNNAASLQNSTASLLDDWETLEALADNTPDIDPWCSGPDWVIPVHHAFAGDAEPVLLGSPATGGVALLARYVNQHEEPVLAGMEPLWGFASPVLSEEPGSFVPNLAQQLEAVPDWRYLVLPGLPKSGELTRHLFNGLKPLGRVGLEEGILRQVADLEGDADGWLARRSVRFRRQIRAMSAAAADGGVSFQDLTDGVGLMERLLAVEEAGWKGRVGDGITAPAMRSFYTRMVARLSDRGRLRATIAIRNGIDVGFILGGVRGAQYRGLQLSYAESVRHLSLGHVLQYREIRALAALGIGTYDMGMDMEYKRRWADRSIPTATLFLLRN